MKPNFSTFSIFSWIATLLFLLSVAQVAQAQTTLQSVNGWCETGATSVTTAGIPSSNKVQGSYPFCSVTVYQHGTAILANLYLDSGGLTLLPNPFTATATGQWQFYTSPQRVDIVMNGGGMPSQVTLTDISVFVAGSPAGTVSTTGSPASGSCAQFSGPLTITTASGPCVTNPMTTLGDLIVGGTSGVLARLGIGANTYILTSNGTTESWQPAPSSMVFPGTGVANSTGSAWGTSFQVGTAANDLVQLNGTSQLPAVSAALLTNFPTLNQNTTGTASNVTGIVAAANGGTGATTLAGANIPVQSGTITAGHCVDWLNSTTIQDAGAACGSGGGGATLQTNGTNNASQTTLNLQSGTFVSETNASAGNVKADLSASGTPSSTTFLRGDNTWATPSATAGVSSLQWDALGPFNGALDFASGAGLVTQAGTAPVNVEVSVQQASPTLFGGVMLGGALSGTYNSQQVLMVDPSVVNDPTNGTGLNLLAKIISSGAVTAGTGDATGVVGIVVGNGSKVGSAQIATQGIATCQFDATAITVGDWVQISSTIAGDCHDAGATKPASGEIVGHAVTGGLASTTQSVLVEVSW